MLQGDAPGEETTWELARDGHGAGTGAQDVEGLAVRDRHQPGPDVAVGSQPRIGAQGRDERLGSRVLGIVVRQQRAADPQHDAGVLGDDVLERWQAHITSTPGTAAV